MATNWAEDVKKYDPSADDGIIAGIVRYCGIALQKRDSSLVSFGDVKETGRVRQNFLKKKLAVEEPDSVLDAAIAAVGERMKGENFKNRVTVYYLLAQHFGKLSLFQKAPTKRAASKGGAAVAAGAGAGAMGLASLGGGSAEADGNAASAADGDDSLTGKAAAGIGAVGAGAAAAVGSAGKSVADTAGDAAGAAADTAKDSVAGARNLAHDAADGAADLAHDAAAGVSAAGAAVAGAAGAAVAGVAELFDREDSRHTSGAGTTGSHYADTDNNGGGLGWLWWLLAALLLIGLVWWLFLRQPAADAGSGAADITSSAPATTTAATTAGDAPAAGTVFATAPAEGTVAIPAGAGVTSELRAGKPVVKVYFDTASAAVVPAFGDAAGGLKAWLAANPGTSLAVSGYNDSTGNAAANAELSKNRAFAVRDALIASGIAEGSVETVKPEATTAGAGDDAAARRVEVVVR